MGVVPVLSADQRSAALRKATAVRMARREFKNKVEAGEFRLAEAIAAAKADEALAGIRCADLLQCLPSVGPIRSGALMEKAGIASSRRVRGLGEHQVAALVREAGR